jgi:hypothetical protein
MSDRDALIQPSADGSPAESSRLLRRLDAWPFLRIERRGQRAVLYGSVRHQVIGTLDLRTGTLTADVGPDLSRELRESHPRLQVTRRGVRLDVTDAGSRMAAEALVRWRVDLERFAPQWREASP